VQGEDLQHSGSGVPPRLPGATDATDRTIVTGCESLAELALLPQEQLGALMGARTPRQDAEGLLGMAKCPSLVAPRAR